jgi:hypothetical protein
MATTILLVDDHPLFRKGLRLLLEEQEAPYSFITFRLTANGCIIYTFLYFIYGNQEGKWL